MLTYVWHILTSKCLATRCWGEISRDKSQLWMQLGTRDDAGSVRPIGDSSLLSGARTKAPEMDFMIVQERIPIPLHYMVDICRYHTTWRAWRAISE